MDEAAVQDLKQFITVAISRQTADMRHNLQEELDERIGTLEKKFDGRIDALERRFDRRIGTLERKVDGRISQLNNKIDTLSEFMFTTMERLDAVTHKQLKDHEHRIRRLERRAA